MPEAPVLLDDGRTLADTDLGASTGPVIMYFHGAPGDVAALADHIGVQDFAVLGLSSGGPCAPECAACLPDRGTAAAIVEGETDFAWAGAWDDYAEYEGR